MADQKISQLTDGTSFQAGDEAVVNRSGTNYKVDPTQFGSSIDVTGTVTADGLTVDGSAVVDGNGVDATFSVVTSSAPNLTSTILQRAKSSNSADAETAIVVTGSGGQQVGSWDFKADTTNGALTKVMSINGGGDISFYEDTGTTPKLFWDASAESLGIGTTSPSYLISTSQDVSTTGSDFAGLNDNTLANFQNVNTTIGTGSYIRFQTSTGSGNVWWAGLKSEGSSYDSDFIFSQRTAASTATERLRIDSAGRVGIGTSSPAQKFVVQADSDSTTTAQITNSDTGTAARANYRLVADAAQMDIYATSSTYNGVASWTDAGVINTDSGASGGLILNAQAGAIKFQYGTTERMRLTSLGRLGIGTTSPATALDVAGTVTADGLTVDGNAKLSKTGGTTLFLEGSGAVGGDLLGQIKAITTVSLNSDNPASIRFYSSGSAGGHHGGYVSIFTNPESSGGEIERLQVTENGVIAVKDTSGNDSVAIGASGGAIFNEQSNDVDFRVESDGNTHMLFVDAGNDYVGIGTSSPAAPLHVNGNARVPYLQGTKTFSGIADGVATTVLTIPQANFAAHAIEVSVLVDGNNGAAVRAAKFIWITNGASGTYKRTVLREAITSSSDTISGNRSISDITATATTSGTDEILQITATHGGAITFTSDFIVTFKAISGAGYT